MDEDGWMKMNEVLNGTRRASWPDRAMADGLEEY